MSIDELLKLPFQVQLAIAGGYSTYILTYSGIRSHHKTIDSLFITFVFSFFTTCYYVLAYNYKDQILIDAGLAIILSWITGSLWRKFIRGWVSKFLKWSNVSWGDDDPSALASLLSSSDYAITQIGVMLEDGSWLKCINAANYTKSPFGPCVIGPNGDIAMYVDASETNNGFKRCEEPRDGTNGDLITHIQASDIKRMTIRYKKAPANRPSYLRRTLSPLLARNQEEEETQLH